MAEEQNLPDEYSLSDEFYYNVKMAFAVSTFTEVLLAMSLKLLELGVPSAETMDEADEINHPLRMAWIDAENIKEHNAARDRVVIRVWQLGKLLPPELEDAAFLLDRAQVRQILRRLPDFASNELSKKFEEDADLGDWYYDSTPNGTRHRLAVGNWSAKTRFSDPFEGLGQNLDFFASVYSGSRDLPPQESQTQNAPSDVSQATSTDRTDGAVDTRTFEKSLFEDAVFGSPFHGDVAIFDVLSTAVLSKLLWAIQENMVNDVLWALTMKLIELDVPSAPTERETASLIVALTLAYDYVAENNDEGIRRQAVDTLRLHLIRVVGLLPQGVWSSDFLDTRDGVLKLIGDRAQEGIGASGSES